MKFILLYYLILKYFSNIFHNNILIFPIKILRLKIIMKIYY